MPHHDAQAGVLTIACPAKVNLALGVASPHPDGMHPIASWMVTLDLADQLTLTKQRGRASRFAIQWAEDAPVAGVVDWPLEKDLMYRAHRLLKEQVGAPLPVTARLIKSIPTGAGLGGGSSDAAAMLVGLDRLFDLAISTQRLCDMALTLGSDVPFVVQAMRESPSAIVQGFGQDITPVPMAQPITLLLIFPGVACATGAVYKAYDQLTAGQQRTARLDEVSLLAKATLQPDGPFNDLAQAAFLVQPALEAVLSAAASKLSRPVHVTGSGSTLFCVAQDEAHAGQMADVIKQELSLPCVVARTLG